MPWSHQICTQAFAFSLSLSAPPPPSLSRFLSLFLTHTADKRSLYDRYGKDGVKGGAGGKKYSPCRSKLVLVSVLL